jgi:hypothetical protein
VTVTHRIRLGRGTWDSALRLETQIRLNVGKIDRNTNEADVQTANVADKDSYLTLLTDNGYNPTDLGSVVEPPPEPIPPPPTRDELTRDAEVATAFNTIIEAEDARIRGLVEAEYDRIKTTTELFLMRFDIKHLRQRAR